jgi:FdhD protein
MRHKPQRAHTTPVVEWQAGRNERRLDDVAAEEPLEIRVDGVPVSVTMRTPGDDLDLAVGFLFTEGIVRSREEIRHVAYGRGPEGEASGNIVEVTRSESAAPLDFDHILRQFPASSSCGICGKATIDSVAARNLARPSSATAIDPDVLCRLPDAMRHSQTIFARTGGLHAAALFDFDGRFLVAREDIGRHNAVDKVIGRALAAGDVPLSNRILFVSGRGGFEIVQKALVAGLPVVASVSAPSSLAVRLAREWGLTLVGFLRGTRFIVYAGEERLMPRDVVPREA